MYVTSLRKVKTTSRLGQSLLCHERETSMCVASLGVGRSQLGHFGLCSEK